MNLASILGKGLTENKFLAFIFHPKKETRPKGVRKHYVVGRGKGRKASRIRAYNRLDGVKQRIVDSVGRERYLRGEVTLGQAKAELRPRAIEKGIAKPVRRRGKVVAEPVAPVAPVAVDDVGPAIRNIYAVAQERWPYKDNGDAKAPIQVLTISKNVKDRMGPKGRELASRITYERLKKEAESTRNLRIDRDTGEIYNPWWYH